MGSLEGRGVEELSMGHQATMEPGSSSLSGHLKIRRGGAMNTLGRRGHVAEVRILCVGEWGVQVKTGSLLY